MLHGKRQNKIIRILKEKRSSNVIELASMLYVSNSTIRRDLEILEKKGYIYIVYGGIMLSEYKNEIIPVEIRGD